MGCATTTIKISSLVFNVVLAVLGVSAIAWIAFNPDALREELAIGAYIVCSLAVIFSFIGCYAAVRESVCLTATCAVFLLLLAILQITLTCIDLSDRENRSGVRAAERAWKNNEMDALQSEHECCGKTSAQDYILLNKQIPASCYVDQNAADVKNLFVDGCSAKLQDYFESETMRFAIISWLIIALELIGFLLAVYLLINFRNTQRRMQF